MIPAAPRPNNGESFEEYLSRVMRQKSEFKALAWEKVKTLCSPQKLFSSSASSEEENALRWKILQSVISTLAASDPTVRAAFPNETKRASGDLERLAGLKGRRAEKP